LIVGNIQVGKHNYRAVSYAFRRLRLPIAFLAARYLFAQLTETTFSAPVATRARRDARLRFVAVAELAAAFR
jgi:hypothetical protein